MTGRCVARLADGRICGAPADQFDDQFCGPICASHVTFLAEPAADDAIEAMIDEGLEFEEEDLY